MKKGKLIDKPEVKNDYDKALELIKQQKALEPTKSLKAIIATDDVKEILLDILQNSFMSPVQKAYLKGIFIDKLPEKKVIKAVFGRDLGYQADAIRLGITNSKAVKEYMELIKLMYINVVPVAQMKEVEIMLNPFVKPETQLKAAKDIQDRAGLGQDDTKTALPVTVIINMPGANPTQVNTEEVIKP